MNIPKAKLNKYKLGTSICGEKNTIIRGYGWTSNGYWLIKTQYEGSILAKISTAKKPMPDSIDRIIPVHELKSLYFVDIDMHRTNMQDEPIFFIFKDSLNIEIRLNKYFVNLFLRIGCDLIFEHSTPLSPVVIKNADTQEVLGLIMPIMT